MRRLGPEAAKNFDLRIREGFFAKYLSGQNILDLGYRGGDPSAVPITENAIGVDLDYPGYDGKHLPFLDDSQDAVFASHCLEHILDYRTALADWYRVLKLGGYLLIMVPHRDLYERKGNLPSRFNGDHKRFYTPASLLREIEESLPVASFRIRSLKDVDEGFDYTVPPEDHPVGSYEIELVLEKIPIPSYASKLRQGPDAAKLLNLWVSLLNEIAEADAGGKTADVSALKNLLSALQLPPFITLIAALKDRSKVFSIQERGIYSLDWFRAVLGPTVAKAPFDREFYLKRYPDIAEATLKLGPSFAREHYVTYGYYEDRIPHSAAAFFD
jgi:SAM-dependent methyltransferase